MRREAFFCEDCKRAKFLFREATEEQVRNKQW